MHLTTCALVLGGGGSAGNAWLIGVAAGLADGGLDVTDADLVIGTSAGATAAAQLTAASTTELFDLTTAPAPAHRSRPPGPGPTTDHLSRTAAVIAVAEDATDMRRRMGASALTLPEAADLDWTARWRTTVAARLPVPHWPDREVLLTAVDARTGEPVVFDRRSGVELVDAVAASTAGGPPYAIEDRWFIDGGYRRNENADLAAGRTRALVLSPFGGRSRHPENWSMQLSAQVDQLRAGGSRVQVIAPDQAALDAFGPDMMDLSRRPASARAGHDQGRTLAADLTAFWRR